jgi:prepilin-type processing-associated H-X9-DG protein
VGMLTYILPYVEANNVFDVLMSGVPNDYLSITAVHPAYWNYDSAWQAANTKIKTFLCPADDAYSNTKGTNAAIYCWRVSSFEIELERLYFEESMYPTIGRTNYIGVSGYGGFLNLASVDVYAGPFYNRSAVSTEMQDGASNTLMVGEHVGDVVIGPRQFSSGWMGCGALATFPGIPADTNETDAPSFSFGSKHPNVVNFCWADGHVSALRKDIPPAPGYMPYQYAAGSSEGRVYPLSDLEP